MVIQCNDRTLSNNKQMLSACPCNVKRTLQEKDHVASASPNRHQWIVSSHSCSPQLLGNPTQALIREICQHELPICQCLPRFHLDVRPTDLHLHLCRFCAPACVPNKRQHIAPLDSFSMLEKNAPTIGRMLGRCGSRLLFVLSRL